MFLWGGLLEQYGVNFFAGWLGHPSQFDPVRSRCSGGIVHIEQLRFNRVDLAIKRELLLLQGGLLAKKAALLFEQRGDLFDVGALLFVGELLRAFFFAALRSVLFGHCFSFV